MYRKNAKNVGRTVAAVNLCQAECQTGRWKPRSLQMKTAEWEQSSLQFESKPVKMKHKALDEFTRKFRVICFNTQVEKAANPLGQREA